MMNFFKSPAAVKKQVQEERRAVADKVQKICRQDEETSATEKLAELREQVLQVVQGTTPVDALDLAAYKKFMNGAAKAAEQEPERPRVAALPKRTELPAKVTGSRHTRRTG